MMKKYFLFTLIASLFIISTSLSAANEAKDKAEHGVIILSTKKQPEIRSSYPFPDFMSTGPYIWYNDVKNKPLKGHTYRISTFTDRHNYRIYIEKVEFGDNGCCLEIVEYRELLIDEELLKSYFPNHRGMHGFKLIRWVKPEIFEFEAYSGKYRVSHIGSDKPHLVEIKPEK